jgi:hypothetical protein
MDAVDFFVSIILQVPLKFVFFIIERLESVGKILVKGLKYSQGFSLGNLSAEL